jgi:hypothetical protein
LELLRSAPSSEKVLKLSKIGRSLSLQLAIQRDSSLFNHFFIQEILPRYSRIVDPDFLLELSKELELFEEAQEFLEDTQPELPKKRKAPKTSTASSIKQSPLRRSPRFAGLKVVYKEKKVKPERNLSRNAVKKQINVKAMKRIFNLTPEPAEAQISVYAKKLKEFNQKYFYDKKEGKSEGVETEGEVLVMSTPTKQENTVEYDVKQFKNLFNV